MAKHSEHPPQEDHVHFSDQTLTFLVHQPLHNKGLAVATVVIGDGVAVDAGTDRTAVGTVVVVTVGVIAAVVGTVVVVVAAEAGVMTCAASE